MRASKPTLRLTAGPAQVVTTNSLLDGVTVGLRDTIRSLVVDVLDRDWSRVTVLHPGRVEIRLQGTKEKFPKAG